MIRVWSEAPNNDNHFQRMYQACEDWVASYNETLETERLDLTHVDSSAGDTSTPEHTVGHWRFAWHEDHTQLLDDLESDLQGEVDWYRIKYHECDHDQSEGRVGCSWDETREFGTIPDGL